MNAVQSAISHWEYIAPVLAIPNTVKDYDTLVKDLDSVLDAGGADENHPLAGLADRMADLVAAYEDQHYPMPQTTGVDALKFLMEEHSLKQSLALISSNGTKKLCSVRARSVSWLRCL